MQFAIYGRYIKEGVLPVIQEIFDTLQSLGANFIIYEDYYATIRPHITIDQPTTFNHKDNISQLNIDMLLTLGGDGTMLDAPLLVRSANIPVAGINLGRLGFLTGIGRSSIQKGLEALMKGYYNIEKRTLLQLDANFPLFGQKNLALNDCTISKRDTSSMITLHTYINGEFLNSYWADGLIISTPTGSTGYSLSCGGPIIFPNSGNFVLTPIAPHNLNVRPMVIPNDSVLSFEIEGRAENYLCTLDSRYELVTTDFRITLKKADFDFNLVRLPENGFLSAIRNKLSWGVDKRN